MKDKARWFTIGFLIIVIFIFLWFVQYGYAWKNDHGGFTPVTLCHATHSQTHPYDTITVDNQGQLNGHIHHDGDIIPAPASGCPTPSLSPTLIPTPSDTECEGGDAYSIAQVCPTLEPPITIIATPSATLVPTEQPTPTTNPDQGHPGNTPTPTPDNRLAPQSLPLPPGGIDK